MRPIPSLLFLSLFFYFNSYAQPDDTKKEKLADRSFMFIQSIPLSSSFLQIEPHESSDTDSISKVTPIKGYKIKVLYELKERVYFKYWTFIDSDSLKAIYNGDHLDRVFSIERKKFDQITQPLYNIFKGVEVGAYTIPYRLRSIGGSNFDFLVKFIAADQSGIWIG